MITHVLVKQTGPTPELLKSELNAIMKETLKAVAENHFNRFMPYHFQMIAFARYGYKPRKGQGQSGVAFYKSYTGRKLKETGQVNPLVYSGESRELALAQPPRIDATRYSATLIQRARGLNRRNPNSDIRMHEEISAVAASELREALTLAGKEFNQRVRDIRATKTTQV